MADQFDTQTQPTTHQGKNKKSIFISTQNKIFIGIGIVVVLLIAGGFVASRSVPGESLYTVKIHILEDWSEGIQATPGAKAAYQSVRLRERLSELELLISKGAIAQDAREKLQAAVLQHSQTLQTLVQAESDAPTQEILTAVSDFADVAAAMEVRSEREVDLQELGEFMEDVRRDTVNLYQEHTDRYVERETPERIIAFVQTLLKDVSSEINNANISEKTLDDAQVYINRVELAMAGKNYPRAVTSIAEAKRIIMVEKYGVLEVTQDTAGADNATTSNQSEPSQTNSSTTEATSSPADASATFSLPQ